MKHILLNWLPPSQEQTASPAFSALKTSITQAGFKTDIKYWNLSFSHILKNFCDFKGSVYQATLNKLMPFLTYLALDYNEPKAIAQVKYQILSTKPELHGKGEAYLDNYLKEFYRNMNHFINSELDKIELNDYYLLGFSSQFLQWIVANILIKIIKQKNPDLKFVIGGFGTKEEAMAFMKNFPFYDYATWGEGENFILDLIKYSAKSQGALPLEKISKIVYRKDNILVSNSFKSNYINLNEFHFDVSDYFEQVNEYVLDNPIAIPIEGSRGCHWRKCHFCILNEGYKFRRKSNLSIIEEIRTQITLHKVSNFMFLDNDIIGRDFIKFEDLLDKLIELRQEFNNFSILLAEIVTKGISYSLIKKMSLSGFKAVQIGYESLSDQLLKKINKKNTLASNLFFIKWAKEFGIRINGANIIRNLLEEEIGDIEESISNLYYFRFFLNNDFLTHNLVYLGITTASPYFNELVQSGRLKEWDVNKYYDLLPENYVKEEDKFTILSYFINVKHNKLWNVFEKIDSQYLDNIYEYTIIHYQNALFYREYSNKILINELEFDYNDVQWYILKKCNHQIWSKKELIESAINENIFLDDNIDQIILDLKSEGLIYYNKDHSEILTLINTDCVST